MSADLVVQRSLVVLAIQHDPHVESVRAHRWRQTRLELLLDDGSFQLELRTNVGHAVRVLASSERRAGDRGGDERRDAAAQGNRHGVLRDATSPPFISRSFSWRGISHSTPLGPTWAFSSKRAYQVL